MALECTCGRDDLEVYGRLGEPAEHDDGCPIWENAVREMALECNCDKLNDDDLAQGYTCYYCYENEL